MAKTTTICTLTTLLFLLLLFSSHATARPGPAFHDVTPIENHHSDQDGEKEADRDNCVGLKDDECMMKRMVEAQLDYIYNQNKKKP
ncbi:phytosulfokines 3-like [Salvia hispanica]|uniref:phytosulfokines 3-like n=1 Tax=Salvia hispanica TaxID=49212 RepID=UPI0020090E61|nr:phytosulfokines 3-like [Salvia hispanica]XP_047977965.1 phytosulfokines 3-like [Salvia hispanica]